MYKSIFALLIVGLLIAGPALAGPPPAYGGYPAGWGNNPTEWQRSFGTCYKWALFSPIECHPPEGEWNVFVEGDLVGHDYCCEITIEMWIELYALMTYDYTAWMFHRLGDEAETVNGFITGTMQSNHPQCMNLVPGMGFNLNYLQFAHNVWGHREDIDDIPLNWGYVWGSGLDYPDGYADDPAYRDDGGIYYPIEPDNEGILSFCIDVECDHWFIWWFWFYLPYHVDDGYYYLLFAGCPVPLL